MEVVHLVPGYVDDRPGSGIWKDVLSHEQALKTLTPRYTRISFKGDAWKDLISRLPAADHFVVEYTKWPGLLRGVKQKFPMARVHVRATNAESLQHWSRYRASSLLVSRNALVLYQALRVAIRDLKSCQLADTVLCITPWELRHYWKYFRPQKAVYLPYFCPWVSFDAAHVPTPYLERPRQFICMPGARDRLSLSQIEGFVEFAQRGAVLQAFRNWSFFLTKGVFETKRPRPSDHVEYIECLDDPWQLLCNSRCVALLSPLGFGMKTTIVDAVAAGCHVLIHPRLAPRLPSPVRRACISVSPTSEQSIDDIARTLAAAPRIPPVNEQLRRRALTHLSRVLEGHSGS